MRRGAFADATVTVPPARGKRAAARALAGLDVQTDPPICQPGERVAGVYLVQHRLGGGAGGQVYLAHDTLLDRPVALKLQRAERDTTAQFRAEAQALARVRHPGVVAVHALGEHRGAVYIAMEYAEGTTLADLRQQRGALPLQEVLELAESICDGLAAAHAEGLVHRDIKPSNLRVRQLPAGGWQVKIIDFGIARRWQSPASTASQNGGPQGTPAYMAPEQVSHGGVDARSDVYSLALVLTELLLGRHPLRATDAAAWMRAQVSQQPDLPEAEGALGDVLEVMRRALDKDPAGRPPGAAALWLALQDAAGRPTWRRLAAQQQASAATGVVVLLHGVAEAALVTAADLMGEHGGEVVSAAAGQLLAVWGRTTLRDAEPLQALRAARLCAARGLAGQVAAALGPVHCSANAGGLVVSGAAPAAAVALLREAQPAEPGVWLSAALWRRLRDDVAATPRGPGAWLAASEDAMPALVPPATPQLVGRGLELLALETAGKRVAQRRELHVLVVAGPAGSGRSALLGAASAAAVGSGARVLQARCTPLDPHTPFAPLGSLVARLVGAPADPESQREQVALRLVQTLRADGTEDAALAEARAGVLAQALGWQARPAEGHAATAESAPAHALASWARGAAAAGPLWLVLDDAQWTGPSARAVLHHLIRAAGHSPLLLVLAVRQAELDGLLAALHVPAAKLQVLELQPFSADEVATLLGNALALPILPEQATELIEAGQVWPESLWTTVQLAQAQRTSGMDGPNALQRVLEGSLGEFLLARFGLRTSRERLLLQALAVLDPAPPPDILGRLIGAAGEAELARAELTPLQADGWLARDGLRWTSERARQVVLSTLPLSEQRKWHRAAARHYLDAGARQPDAPARAAHHLALAGDDGAARQLLAVGEAAQSASAFRDALQVFSAAVRLLQAAQQPDNDALARALVGEAEAAFVVAEVTTAARAATTLLALPATQPDQQARAQEVLGDLAELRGDYTAAAEHFASAEALAAPVAAGRACKAAARRAMVLWKAGDEAAAERFALQALGKYPDTEADCAAGRGRLFTSLGHVAARRGNTAEAARYYDAARQAFDASRDAIGAAMTWLSLGNLAYRSGQGDKAAEHWQTVVELCQLLCYPHGEALARTNLGTWLLERQRPAEARQQLERSADLKRSANRLDTLPETLRLLALAWHQLGNAAQAKAAIGEALQRTAGQAPGALRAAVEATAAAVGVHIPA